MFVCYLLTNVNMIWTGFTQDYAIMYTFLVMCCKYSSCVESILSFVVSLGLCKDVKITIVLDLSYSVLNLVKVCHKSVSLVIAICSPSCPLSNCFQAIHFWRPWTVEIDFLVISCL